MDNNKKPFLVKNLSLLMIGFICKSKTVKTVLNRLTTNKSILLVKSVKVSTYLISLLYE
jgi:hypothetical protein